MKKFRNFIVKNEKVIRIVLQFVASIVRIVRLFVAL